MMFLPKRMLCISECKSDVECNPSAPVCSNGFCVQGKYLHQFISIFGIPLY